MPDKLAKIEKFKDLARRRSSILIAAVLAIAVTVYIATGSVGNQVNTVEAAGEATPTATLFAVSVETISAESRQAGLVINGRTEASRTVDVRAEIEGQIVELNTYRGEAIEEADVIARISLYDRAAKLAEAQALLRQREIEYAASMQLQEQGFRSATQHAGARALRDGARAIVVQRETAIERTFVRAPFTGVIHSGHSEMGDYVREGDIIGTVLDLDPILIVGHATEMEVGALPMGGRGGAELMDGAIIQGRISYVAARADDATRTYRFEIEVPNPDHTIRAGLTARILVEAGQHRAHKISPSTLTLSTAGEIGVKIVDDSDRVKFVAVRIVEEASSGMWVSGLPDTARVIIRGQEFAAESQIVKPVEAEPPSATAQSDLLPAENGAAPRSELATQDDTQ